MTTQSQQQILSELDKLSKAQRKSLRKAFPGEKGIIHLECNEFLGRVDVVKVAFADTRAWYRVWIGPRGAVKSRECIGRLPV